MSPEAVLRIVVAVAAVAIVLALISYNRLVRSRNRVKEAWSGVEVQLGRRGSLIPNLVETVRAYAGHERQLFESVARARTAVAEAPGAAAASEASVALSQTVGRLLALVEAYPALKASESFARLHAELSDVEAKIAFARHFYNRTVLDYNTRVGSVPGLVIAPLFGFRPAEFFEVPDETRSVTRVGFAQPETPREGHGA
jgi:LemA protein